MDSDSHFSEVAQQWCNAKGYILCNAVKGGAFKKVFQVRTNEDRHFALKLVKSAIAEARTEREIAALQKCNHPSIAVLHDVGSFVFNEQECQYMLEEFLDGGTLKEKLEHRHFDFGQTINLGTHLIDALEHIASLDLVHRDIKPENIMFRGGNMVPVLVDFNLVRDLSAGSLTQSWHLRGPGTPYFAAPEQLNNEKHLIDCRTDQFSLGVVLCLAFAGRHPYQHESEPLFSSHTVEKVANRKKPDASVLEQLAQAGLTCIMKMIDPWPVGRYRNPVELKNAWEKQGGQ